MSIVSGKITGLYMISDTSASHGRGHEELVRQAVAGGARIVQLREKWLSLRDAYPVALRLREITREAGVLFIVNDSVELALAVDADGVHLGQDDMPLVVARKVAGGRLLIGISTHSIEEARAAEDGGADYIGFGPIFPTGTKDAGEARGTEGLRAVRAESGLPIAAIGGIDASNAQSVLDAGADALAFISAITGADDIKSAVMELSAICVRRP